MHVDHQEAPPPALTPDESDETTISTELPVVVLGDDDEALVSAEIPRVRLLQGRVYEGYVLYPIYLLVAVGGALAVNFALTTPEWSAPVAALAWGLLFIWNWFYGVAYRYRRKLLKFTSVVAVVGLSVALAGFALDRAAAQVAMSGPTELAQRDPIVALYGAAVVTVAAAALLVAHLVFLGTGYRRKREPRGS